MERSFAQAFEEKEAEPTKITFQRLGVTGDFYPLTPSEIDEARGISGVRGRQYALYLSCPALREQGQQLYEEGKVVEPLAVMDKLALADVLAAFKVVMSISGAAEPRLSVTPPGGEEYQYQAEQVEAVADELGWQEEEPTESYTTQPMHKEEDSGQEPRLGTFAIDEKEKGSYQKAHEETLKGFSVPKPLVAAGIANMAMPEPQSLGNDSIWQHLVAGLREAAQNM